MCNITRRTRDAERAIADCADRLGIHDKHKHLGLWVDDFESTHEAVIRLGVRVLKPVAGATVGGEFQVSADPGGHPFCSCFLVGDGSIPDPTS